MADHAHAHDHDHADHHEPGSMDIRDHEKTFAGFIRMVCWAGGLSILALIFLALVNA